MPEEARDFTVEQAAAASTALRDALGLPPERFGVDRFVSMMSDEIEQLRASGCSDQAVSDLLRDRAGVQVGADAISRYYASPQARGRR